MKLTVEEQYDQGANTAHDAAPNDQDLVKSLNHATYIFERISLPVWVFCGIPFLSWRLFAGKQRVMELYYVDGSECGIGIARLTSRIFGASLKRLEFILSEIKDDNNDLYWFHMFTDELPALLNMIKKSESFQNIIDQMSAEDRLPEYLSKKILEIDPTMINKRLAWLLFIFRVIHLKVKDGGYVCMIVDKTLWFTQIKNFAKTRGIELVTLEKFNLRILLFEFVRLPLFKKSYHIIVYFTRKMALLFRAKSATELPQEEASAGILNQNTDASLLDQNPKLAVEYYGQLNLDSPELFSDLFFWQMSDLSGDDIVIYSQMAHDPIDRKKYYQMRSHNLHPFVINRNAAVTSKVPVARYSRNIKPDVASSKKSVIGKSTSEERWLKKQIHGYERQRDYWRNLFIQHNVKMSLSWYKGHTLHMIMADAAKDVGGVGVLYQRSFEGFHGPWFMTNTDVFFGFSSLGSLIEKESGSTIPYYVVTGYLGDHRNGLLKEYAQAAKESLQKSGAKKIIAYFDESSSADEYKGGISHSTAQENYFFLLSKVLENPELGIILKPKVPSSLRKNLGPINELLNDVEQTGRCFIFQDGAMHGSYPPAVAALGADIAIHGHLMAGTAGVEAALAGTPTVYLDREKCSMSSLYRLREGEVIFHNWNDLWNACKEHWKTKTGVPGFGDWSSVIEDFDPFRDGRAAERMGTYLKWILDGLKSNLSRETVLENAAERYRETWGQDKVLQVNC